jgi:hypothetical protein
MIGPTAKPVFDVHYADSRTSIVLEANLDRGWTKLQKTYGFFHQTRIPYRNDLTIRAQLQVISQPASFDEWAEEFPDLELDKGDDDFMYRVHNKQLVLKVALAPHQPWRTTRQGRPELFIELLPLCQGRWRWYDLRAWIVFHEGARHPVPNVRVWTENNLVVPGGQFESKRQRH